MTHRKSSSRNIPILSRRGKRIDEVHAPCDLCQSEGLMVTAFAKRFGTFQSPKGSLCMQNCLREDTTAVPFGEREWGFAIDNRIFVMLVL